MEMRKDKISKEIDRALREYESNQSKIDELYFIKELAKFVINHTENIGKGLLALTSTIRLIDGFPLIALNNEKDDWLPIDVAVETDKRFYVHKYRDSLMKEVNHKGDKEEITYVDTDIITCVDINGGEYDDGKERALISSVDLTTIVNMLYPVEFPYFPTKRFRAYYCHPKKTADLVEVIKLMHPSGALLPFKLLLKYNEEKDKWEVIKEVEQKTE